MIIIDVLGLLLLIYLSGVLGQILNGYAPGGILLSLTVDFLGTLLGGFVWQLLTLPDLIFINLVNLRFPVVWSIIGSTVLVLTISFRGWRRV